MYEGLDFTVVLGIKRSAGVALRDELEDPSHTGDKPRIDYHHKNGSAYSPEGEGSPENYFKME